jgi:hypothetical protein
MCIWMLVVTVVPLVMWVPAYIIGMGEDSAGGV